MAKPTKLPSIIMDKKLFVYVDSMCSGVRYGVPTWEFQNNTVKEFAEIALGVRRVGQGSTTGHIGF